MNYEDIYGFVLELDKLGYTKQQIKEIMDRITILYGGV